jgi:glycine/D-amino acid oxidase-like deaminating enzyme
MASIVVIGYELMEADYRAGVAGLTTALVLARKGYKVTVVARHVPGDLSTEYTSPWAVSP